MPVPKESQSVCTQPVVVALVTNSRLNPCGDIKEVARRLSSQSCDKNHNPQGNVPIANERRIRLAEDALSAQFGTSILAAGDGSFTSTRAVDTANGRVVPKRSTNLEQRAEDFFNFRSDNGNLTCVITNIPMTSGELSKSRSGLFKRRG
jgi:hypothetical protein